ncbi:MAG: hypothetical protein JNK45_11300 [Myxococcales bacterium]|nr:hypothetical protein [Myxococcales bacterium]
MHVPPSLLLGWMLQAAAPDDPLDATWTLDWTAPPGCPSAAEVEQIVVRWRRSAPTSLPPLHVGARGRVVAVPTGGFALALDLTTEGTLTHHDEHAEDCDVLAEATALQVAMALGFLPDGPASTDASTVPVPAPPATIDLPAPLPSVDPSATARPTAGPADPSPRAAPASAPRRRRPLGLRGAVRLQGSAGTGRVPRIDAGLGLAGALLWPRARLDVVVAHTFLQRQPHPDRAGLSLRVWQWTGRVRGCWVPRVGVLELPLCGGLEVGASRATSRGVLRTRVAESPFVASVLAGALVWPFTRRLALWVELDGWVAWTQPAFTVQDLAPWFTTRRVGVDGVVGLELRWP